MREVALHLPVEDDLAGMRGAAEPRGEVRHVADARVFPALLEADHAQGRFALSDADAKPDIVAELFVFDKAAEGGSAEIVATAEGQLRERPHGEVDDRTGAATQAAPTGEPEATPQ